MITKGRNAHWTGLVAATVAFCWLLPGGLAAQDKPLTPVRAAYVPVATWLPAWVALDKGIFAASPFETLDRDGVGRLVRIAVDEGRAARPDLKIGVCGEHGGDPGSVHFFHAAGLDYVSCSPFRVPVARLEAGRAALSGTGTSDSR